MDIDAIKSKLATLQSTSNTKDNFWKPEPGKQVADPDYGDITDATNGRDIGIDRQTPAEAGNQYGKTTVRVKPNMTPITEDADMLQGIFDNQSNLTELYNEPTYDELKEVLQNFLNPSDDSEESAPTNTTEKVAEQTATKSTADVSDAFDNLFNN
jgi:hypothetical protein